MPTGVGLRPHAQAEGMTPHGLSCRHGCRAAAALLLTLRAPARLRASPHRPPLVPAARALPRTSRFQRRPHRPPGASRRRRASLQTVRLLMTGRGSAGEGDRAGPTGCGGGLRRLGIPGAAGSSPVAVSGPGLLQGQPSPWRSSWWRPHCAQTSPRLAGSSGRSGSIAGTASLTASTSRSLQCASAASKARVAAVAGSSSVSRCGMNTDPSRNKLDGSGADCRLNVRRQFRPFDGTVDTLGMIGHGRSPDQKGGQAAAASGCSSLSAGGSSSSAGASLAPAAGWQACSQCDALGHGGGLEDRSPLSA